MGRNSGGVSGSSGGSGYEFTPDKIQDVKIGLMDYAQQDRWNRNADYQAGFNADAMLVVEKVAESKKNLGLAQTIAKDVTSRPNWKKYGYKFSEKQAFIIARAALQNGLVHKSIIFDKVKIRTKPSKPASTKVQTSSTKTSVGASILGKHGQGTISRIITKSTGYVEVRYSNGTTSKEMAFNLKGADGRPLRNKPGAKSR